MTQVRGAVSPDDSLEREYLVLATQHRRLSQSYHALALALANKREKRLPSRAKERDSKVSSKPSLPFPESELF